MKNHLFAAALGLTTLAALPAQAQVSVDYTFTGASSTQFGRLERDGFASTCAAPKTQSIFATGPFNYLLSDVFYNDTGADVCTTITVTPLEGCEANVFPVAYLGSFNESDVLQNYLADGGISFGLPTDPVFGPVTFEALVPAGEGIVINMVEIPAGTTVCDINISATDLALEPSEPPEPVPAMPVWALWVLGAALGAAGLRKRTKKRA